MIAVAPEVRPSLPAAIDTSKLEAFSSGLWSPLTGQDVLASLQKSITPELNKKSATPQLMALQRESARVTVTALVNKWVAEQRLWRPPGSPAILVFFADEPLGRAAAPLIARR